MLTKKQQLDLLTKLYNFFNKLEEESQDGTSYDSYGYGTEVIFVWDRNLINKVASDLRINVEDYLFDLQEEIENENN